MTKKKGKIALIAFFPFIVIDVMLAINYRDHKNT